MTETVTKELIYETLKSIQENMSTMGEDIFEIKRCITSIELMISQYHGYVAGRPVRIDRIDGRLGRIEQRLTLRSEPMTNADRTLILSALKEIRADLRELRSDVRELRSLTLAHGDAFRPIESRFGDLRDELELLIKTEAVSRYAHFESLYDEKLARLEERLSGIEAGNDTIT